MPDDESWDLTTAALELVCPHCEARPGCLCRTISGNPAEMQHVSRWKPLSIAFAEGYAEGRSDAAEIAERQATR